MWRWQTALFQSSIQAAQWDFFGINGPPGAASCYPFEEWLPI